ncbi:hypothetical protein [Dyella sp. A6]|uniref:hypothetical protein n=1 Tax=Dyella aluminiiresistens TaxID=3069105 RepID=UPI002E768F69|nr:hypothetical protein [Dyella sp. A6]
MASKLSFWMPAVLLVAFVPAMALAADGSAAATKQAATAAAHAGMSLGAGNLKTAHLHLHHVVNCLVGPSGWGFDAKAGDPCKGMGHGAIADAKGDKAMEARLHKALADARSGLKSHNLATAHADAKKAMETLQAK